MSAVVGTKALPATALTPAALTSSCAASFGLNGPASFASFAAAATTGSRTWWTEVGAPWSRSTARRPRSRPAAFPPLSPGPAAWGRHDRPRHRRRRSRAPAPRLAPHAERDQLGGRGLGGRLTGRPAGARRGCCAARAGDRRDRACGRVRHQHAAGRRDGRREVRGRALATRAARSRGRRGGRVLAAGCIGGAGAGLGGEHRPDHRRDEQRAGEQQRRSQEPRDSADPAPAVPSPDGPATVRSCMCAPHRSLLRRVKGSAMPSDHQVDAPEEGIADTFSAHRPAGTCQAPRNPRRRDRATGGRSMHRRIGREVSRLSPARATPEGVPSCPPEDQRTASAASRRHFDPATARARGSAGTALTCRAGGASTPTGPPGGSPRRTSGRRAAPGGRCCARTGCCGARSRTGRRCPA
jgi:hypothetical protein